MFVDIRGKRWRYVRRKLKDLRGYCQAPTTLRKQIVIDSRLRGIELLATILHELLHAAFWDLDEEVVEQVCRDFARVLWRLGWRPPDDR